MGFQKLLSLYKNRKKKFCLNFSSRAPYICNLNLIKTNNNLKIVALNYCKLIRIKNRVFNSPVLTLYFSQTYFFKGD